MEVTWKIKDSDIEYNDSELIFNIKNGRLNGDTLIINSDLKKYVAIKDSLYSVYLKKGENNEKR